MKKLQFYFFPFFILLICLAVFNSCQKNMSDIPFIQNADTGSIYGLSITEAKLFFENKSQPGIAFRKGNNNNYHFKIKQPLWNKAMNATDSNYYIVEAPVAFDQSPGFTFSNSAAGAQPDKANDVARLLILKNKKTGEMHTALMHIVSDNGIEDKSITYNNRNSHFSGFIFYTDTEGNFINGWKYENGKIARKSSKDNQMKKTNKRVGTGQAVSLMAPPDPGPVNCTTYETDWYERTCTEYTNGSVSCSVGISLYNLSNLL